jgi:hypothetical protein
MQPLAFPDIFFQEPFSTDQTALLFQHHINDVAHLPGLGNYALAITLYFG